MRDMWCNILFFVLSMKAAPLKIDRSSEARARTVIRTEQYCTSIASHPCSLHSLLFIHPLRTWNKGREKAQGVKIVWYNKMHCFVNLVAFLQNNTTSFTA